MASPIRPSGLVTSKDTPVNFILDNWALILVAFTSGALLFWPMVSKGGSLSPEAAVLLINREKAVVVDVSEAAEYAAQHVKGAKNIPMAELQAQLPTTVKNKETPVIFVCKSGVRSASAARMAKGLGYAKPLSLAGGIKSWLTAGLPVEKSAV